MSNSCYVVFKDEYGYSPMVYLHWNGGVESVTAFLLELQKVGYHSKEYSCARFAQIVSNFSDDFGDRPNCLNVGVMSFEGIRDACNDSDNGLFEVTWKTQVGIVVTRYKNNERVYHEMKLDHLHKMLTNLDRIKCERIVNAFDKNRVYTESGE